MLPWPSYAVACEQVPTNASGTSMSFANMASVMALCYNPQWRAYPKNLEPRCQKWRTRLHHARFSLRIDDLTACIVMSLIAWCF